MEEVVVALHSLVDSNQHSHLVVVVVVDDDVAWTFAWASFEGYYSCNTAAAASVVQSLDRWSSCTYSASDMLNGQQQVGTHSHYYCWHDDYVCTLPIEELTLDPPDDDDGLVEPCNNWCWPEALDRRTAGHCTCSDAAPQNPWVPPVDLDGN